MEWLRTEPADTEASGAVLVDLVGTLPGEVGSLVLRFLDGRELLTCALVGNWAWHALARDHLPWKSLALARTRHKQRAAVHLFHASLLPAAAAAAVAAPAPATRDNNRSPSAEEADVQGGSDGGAGGGQPRLLPLGSETWEWKEWARAYFGAGREADRARLRSAEELANHSWRFAFRPEAIVTGQTLPTQQFYPQFHADGRYEHHGLFSAPLAWRFIDMPDYDGIEGKRLVQIHRFPALRVRRTADWGWVLENDFVLFESEDPELERKRRKRDQRVKQRIAALSQEELATLSALSEQALCAQLLAWGIEVGNNQGKWSCAEIVAAAVAYIEDVREELRTQEAAKNEELEHARHAHEGYVK